MEVICFLVFHATAASASAAAARCHRLWSIRSHNNRWLPFEWHLSCLIASLRQGARLFSKYSDIQINSVKGWSLEKMFWFPALSMLLLQLQKALGIMNLDVDFLSLSWKRWTLFLAGFTIYGPAPRCRAFLPRRLARTHTHTHTPVYRCALECV